MDFWSDFGDYKSDNPHLLHLQHAAIQYMTLKQLFEYVRQKCEIYQHLQVRGCVLFVSYNRGLTHSKTNIIETDAHQPVKNCTYIVAFFKVTVISSGFTPLELEPLSPMKLKSQLIVFSSSHT